MLTEAPEPKDKLDTMTLVNGSVGHAAAVADGMVNGPEDGALDWNSIVWGEVEGEVRRLRPRIFAADTAGGPKKGRKLQKRMLRARTNARRSGRRVTEINAGRKTAGIDGEVVVTAPEKAE